MIISMLEQNKFQHILNELIYIFVYFNFPHFWL